MILYNCYSMRVSSCFLLCLLSASLVSGIAILDTRSDEFVDENSLSSVINDYEDKGLMVDVDAADEYADEADEAAWSPSASPLSSDHFCIVPLWESAFRVHSVSGRRLIVEQVWRGCSEDSHVQDCSRRFAVAVCGSLTAAALRPLRPQWRATGIRRSPSSWIGA